MNILKIWRNSSKVKKPNTEFSPDYVGIEYVGSSAVEVGGKNIVDILVGANWAGINSL